MLINEIVKNSNYVTDEQMVDANLLGISNLAIAEINSKCGTELPFFESSNLSEKVYWALSSSWLLRLIEPYLSYSISSNDSDSVNRDFHYNRFLQAVLEFKEKGLQSIAEVNPETGEEVNFKGTSDNMAIIDASKVTMHWEGWI